MLRTQVLTEWKDLKETMTDLKKLVITEKLFSSHPNFGNDNNTRLVRIKDPNNDLTTISLTELPQLKWLHLIYSPTKEPHLTSLTIKNSATSVYPTSKLDFSDLWTNSKYFSKVKTLTLHYLPKECFPEKVIDFSAYSSLEKLIVEIAHDSWSRVYEEIILNAPQLKILTWKGGQTINRISGLEQCPRLEIVKIQDATVSPEVGERLKNHPRYQWAVRNKGEDSWEWVVRKDEADLPPDEDEPTIEEVD